MWVQISSLTHDSKFIIFLNSKGYSIGHLVLVALASHYSSNSLCNVDTQATSCSFFCNAYAISTNINYALIGIGHTRLKCPTTIQRHINAHQMSQNHKTLKLALYAKLTYGSTNNIGHMVQGMPHQSTHIYVHCFMPQGQVEFFCQAFPTLPQAFLLPHLCPKFVVAHVEILACIMSQSPMFHPPYSQLPLMLLALLGFAHIF